MYKVTNIGNSMINLFTINLKPLETHNFKDNEYTEAIDKKVSLLSRNNIVKVLYLEDKRKVEEKPIQYIDKPDVIDNKEEKPIVEDNKVKKSTTKKKSIKKKETK